MDIIILTGSCRVRQVASTAQRRATCAGTRANIASLCLSRVSLFSTKSQPQILVQRGQVPYIFTTTETQNGQTTADGNGATHQLKTFSRSQRNSAACRSGLLRYAADTAWAIPSPKFQRCEVNFGLTAVSYGFILHGLRASILSFFFSLQSTTT